WALVGLHLERLRVGGAHAWRRRRPRAPAGAVPHRPGHDHGARSGADQPTPPASSTRSHATNSPTRRHSLRWAGAISPLSGVNFDTQALVTSVITPSFPP